MRFKRWMVVAAAMAVAAMGAGTPPPPPVSLPRPPDPPRPVVAPVTVDLQILNAADADPQEFLLQARPVVVFADTPADPLFVTQLDEFRRDPRTLVLRDVVVVTDTDPAAGSAWRDKLRPRGFSLVVLDKEGGVIERKPTPWTSREIGRAIDKTPGRRNEMMQARGGR